MRRARFLAGLLLICGCSLTKLLSGPSERSSYFPLAVGSTWEYRLVTTVQPANATARADTTTIATYVHQITGTARLADGKPAFVRVWTAQVTLRDSQLAESTFTEAETAYFRCTKKAVYRYQSPQSPPDSILLLPPQIDQHWTSNDVNYWVAGREDVTIADRCYPLCWRVKTGGARDPAPVNTWLYIAS